MSQFSASSRSTSGTSAGRASRPSRRAAHSSRGGSLTSPRLDISFLAIVSSLAALLSTVTLADGTEPLVPAWWHTVEERVAENQAAVERRLRPYFRFADVSYPPERLLLVGLKHERRLELYAGSPGSELRYIRNYPIMGASGGSGPKLREGDFQVPEGMYRVVSLNPNSRFHLSLELDYPNEFDRSMGQQDGRIDLGGEIFIHGGVASIGCVAVGDRFVEELFVLSAAVGIENVEVILSPRDLRKSTPKSLLRGQPAWTKQLYASIWGAMKRLPSGSW